MKPVRVRIRRGKTRGEAKMTYPARYDHEEVGRLGVGPTSVNGIGAYSGGITRGPLRDEEYCYILMPDDLADEYALDPDMATRTEDEADADMEAWRVALGEPEYKVRDMDEVQRVRDAQERGEELNDAEERVLDPEAHKRLRSVRRFQTDSGTERR